MEIKVIKTQKEYLEALDDIKNLMSKNPDPNSSDGEKLELLVTLVEDYEAKMFPSNLPDPIDAILFRMEQQNLKPIDLVPYIGSKSKVSEVLSRRRPLSLNMIKALHEGLDIPAKVLLNQTRKNEGEIDFTKFPIKEMLKRGYLKGKDTLDRELKSFLDVISTNKKVLALLNRTYYIRSPRPMNQNALLVWVGKIIEKAGKEKIDAVFKEDSLNLTFLRKVADISDEDNAIKKVRDLLKSIGILLIVEPHMPQTYLDGAAIMIKKENPIVGMTIRHDRLDNFWFTLLHELAHISLHFGKGTNLFYDDIESIDLNDPREKEADELALRAMIPEQNWKDSPASILPSPDAAKLLADQLSIHPAIVAGKMRYEKKHYQFLNGLIGKGEVRKLFSEFTWQK